MSVTESLPKYNRAGKTIGDWKIAKKAKSIVKNGHRYWPAECRSCGRRKLVRDSHLKDGASTSCGCNRTVLDLADQHFGMLIAVGRVPARMNNGKAARRWFCDPKEGGCGRTVTIETNDVTSGKYKCCGHSVHRFKAKRRIKPGDMFGCLEFIEHLGKGKNRYRFCLCKCRSCGCHVHVVVGNLLSGNTRSCGKPACRAAARALKSKNGQAAATIPPANPPDKSNGQAAATSTEETQSRSRGRPKGKVDPDVADRKKDMLDGWDRGEFSTFAEAARAHGFHRPDASKIIREHMKAKAQA